jgi:hypothetical protein
VLQDSSGEGRPVFVPLALIENGTEHL